ncbi:L-serine ammonia-lyase [Microbacterium barkeri]|uniref:L-serine dehydratase n=1 Tax=Microbacterium barkeri TaxID=33917 RepID=A0A9W6H4H0_9MICO|nr:L-serine ammonia-lyase [Microbacterium barkeri]MDR6876353.1 L-serine dehydratase [Microbacterium barkeri]GLJ61979.1 L-serine ammonia-lyase [Microbacterium barkeri]
MVHTTDDDVGRAGTALGDRAPFVGVFDLFTIGIGPSSSHTVGPMRAAAAFADELAERIPLVAALEVELFGSLAATGAGHGTLTAVLVGLEGCRPDVVRADEVSARAARIERDGVVRLGGTGSVPLRARDIRLAPLTVLARHTNALRFTARDAAGRTLAHGTWYSVGGGFIVREGEEAAATETPVPHPFSTASELLAICAAEQAGIAEIALRNECALRSAHDVREGLLRIRDAMDECVAAGTRADGELPGGLRVRRRAPQWHARLLQEDPDRSPAYAQEWVNLVALAVNEENAAGGRVVTAPTNGAAGIIPAVLHYATHYTPAVAAGRHRDDVAVEFLVTAAAIGSIYKARASISGAEVGCQGEVGSASSMAAGALAAVLGGTPEQVENAAEIAMEHNLGLTCDPVGGLVQIPCIERNAIASGKAVNAAKMAMWGDGTHRVSLDAVIETMRQTGRDMSDKYKETARGGLAVNVVEC